MPVLTDPVTVMTSISVGLKLVDQFRELAIRFLGKKPHAPSASVEQNEDSIQIKMDGNVVNEIGADDMKLDQWDQVRYDTLQTRVKINWELFHELLKQEPLLAADEKARIKVRLERIKSELCEDFREMVKIYEAALGVALPDHYSLYEVCDG